MPDIKIRSHWFTFYLYIWHLIIKGRLISSCFGNTFRNIRIVHLTHKQVGACPNGIDRNIFSGVSYDFEPGIFYILQGENGVGKTTLARIMLGLLKPDSGEVKRPKGCIMSYLPDSNGIYPELTVRQNLRFRLGLYGADRCKSDAALALLEGFVETRCFFF